MKYLVTGGFGFIGSHLVEELVNNGHKVSVLDDLSNGQLGNLNASKNGIASYISNVEQLQQSYFTESFDGIFHLATAPRSSSLNNPMRDIETNCKGMIAVLELAKYYGAKVVFTSNSGIYGSKGDGKAIDESSANDPTTPYDANKLVSEYYCNIYHKIHAVPSVVIRLATIYGERQKVNEKLNWRPLVATLAKNVVNDEQVVIDGDGEQTRDLVYVKDVVQGIMRAMESSIDNAEVFLLSTNKETSVNQVLQVIEEIVGKKADVRYGPPLKGDIRRMRYSYAKAKSKLGFEPKYDIHDGIRKIVDYLQRNIS
ncbi:MAG: NAD-dependent epimerase/dehydratase family protein [Thaumarchaeota archaeon]|nr:MAG: NAD-dependent epimerase/dehydratase family protein [Nitrososphaerota archaeon]